MLVLKAWCLNVCLLLINSIWMEVLVLAWSRLSIKTDEKPIIRVKRYYQETYVFYIMYYVETTVAELI